MSAEAAIAIPCREDTLIGVLHRGHGDTHVGVVVIVGGPQYRVGSHRQFVLLARGLANKEIPVLRFDYRGMGDSSGKQRTFEEINADIRSAVDALCAQVPAIRKVVIWGLCDAASAALFYAHGDTRVCGLVLLNPWVRTEAGMARAYMKHYYLRRLFSGDFWKKVLSGRWNVHASMHSLFELANKLRGRAQIPPAKAEAGVVNPPAQTAPKNALPDRMLEGWECFSGKILLILSGNNDYVADEFRDVVKASRRWRKVIKRASTTRRDFPQANHTFSRSDWRDQVEEWTGTWIQENF